MKIEVEHNGEKWEAELIKKVSPKIVDMSPLINSGVLCQFSDVSWNKLPPQYGFLYGMGQAYSRHPFKEDNGTRWAHCRPALDYYHGWPGGECPIPEGVNGKLYFRGGGSSCVWPNLDECDWEHDLGEADIIGFKLLGLADGYEWP